MVSRFGAQRWALVFALVACGLVCSKVGAADKEAAPETRAATLVTDKDDGKTVKLADKEHLLVALEFRAGTGYQWKLQEECKELHLVHHYVVKPLSAQPIGGVRLAGFDFGPKESGTCELAFDLVSPAGKVEKTVKFTVNVGGPK